MRYLKLFESFDNIDEICKKYGITDYIINSDESIDVDTFVWLRYKELKKLPLKFNKVNGYFDCRYNKLTSLEGSPIEINGSFYCDDNKLTSFEFAPKIIRRDFECRWNNIKTFEYFPSFVKGEFYCYDNPIYKVWELFGDTTKIELLNDCDIFRDEDTDTPSIFINRLNDFLGMIGKDPVKNVDQYKNI